MNHTMPIRPPCLEEMFVARGLWFVSRIGNSESMVKKNNIFVAKERIIFRR